MKIVEDILTDLVVLIAAADLERRNLSEILIAVCFVVRNARSEDQPSPRAYSRSPGEVTC